MQRIIGIETEYAVGFEPGGRGDMPTQGALFGALVRSLKSRHLSCEALYYKGGDFFANGSLIHFEVSRLEDPESGLLEWATPECLGPLEAAHYAKAQERSLVAALADAEAELAANGYDGRLFLLKNNEDRFGNSYGCHESYDVVDHPCGLPAHLATWILHPLILTAVCLLGVAFAIPVIALLLSLLLLALLTQALALIPGLQRVANAIRDSVQHMGEYLVEVSPTPGSGIAAHSALWFLRAGGRLFSISARWVLFSRHLPALWPFLVTRPVFAGAGHLDASGVYRLTARSRAVRRTVAAFIFGPARPLVDVKEFFYRRPFSYRARRKRLHHLAGDANRSEYAELLKLSTTAAVLDAIEGGALDGLARDLKLLGGPLGAFRATSDDPTLSAPVARDRRTGELLTALAVQRRYLEAVWEHFRAQPAVDAEIKDALVRWHFVLDQLDQNPGLLDGELDWVIKRLLLEAVLRDGSTGLDTEGAWARLRAWGPVNALVERIDPVLDLPPQSAPEVVETRLREALGRQFRLAERHVRETGLDWGQFPAVRETWLRLKTVDLKYHELSTEGGYYDWWCAAKRISRVLDPQRVERAMHEPPARTRAGIRGRYVDRHSSEGGSNHLRVGWEKIVIQRANGEARTIHLKDPYQHTLE